MSRLPNCRNGEYYKQNRCMFNHIIEKKIEEKKIGGFTVNSIKEMARLSMNDEEYDNFYYQCDRGAPEKCNNITFI